MAAEAIFLSGGAARPVVHRRGLSSARSELSDSYARHEELGKSLRDAPLHLQSLQNATRDTAKQ